MKRFLLSIIILSCSCNSFSETYSNTLFLPASEQSSSSEQPRQVQLDYGLSNVEITRRIELGLINTIPISALQKWQSDMMENQEQSLFEDGNQTNIQISNPTTDYQHPSTEEISHAVNDKNKQLVTDDIQFIEKQTNPTKTNLADEIESVEDMEKTEPKKEKVIYLETIPQHPTNNSLAKKPPIVENISNNPNIVGVETTDNNQDPTINGENPQDTINFFLNSQK